MDFQFDPSNLSAEDKRMFDDLVREEMEKLERELQREAQEYNSHRAPQPLRRDEKDVYNSQARYGDSYTPLVVHDRNHDQLAPQNGVFGVSGLDNKDAKINQKQFEYRGQLQEQQEAKEKIHRDTNGGRQQERKARNVELANAEHDSTPFGQQDLRSQNKREKQLEYARQLQQDQQNGKMAAPGDAIPNRPRSGRRQGLASPPAASGASQQITPSSSFWNGDKQYLSPSERKRLEQKKYFDELAAAASAQPIVTERVSLRRQQEARPKGSDNYYGSPRPGILHHGPSSNVGVNDDRIERTRKIEQQRVYHQQISEAASQSSITADRVSLRSRRKSSDEDVSRPPSQGRDQCASVPPHAASDELEDPLQGQVSVSRLNKHQGVAAAAALFGGQGVDNDLDSNVQKKLAQQEYFRQLKEDSQKSVIASPRTTIIPKRHPSPEPPVSVRSPAGLFAKGLSPRGPLTSAGLRKEQQKEYLRALQADEETGGRPLRRTSPMGRTDDPGFNGLRFDSLTVATAERELRYRNKKEEYARALAQDQQAPPIESPRVPLRRIVSPVSAEATSLVIGHRAPHSSLSFGPGDDGRGQNHKSNQMPHEKRHYGCDYYEEDGSGGGGPDYGYNQHGGYGYGESAGAGPSSMSSYGSYTGGVSDGRYDDIGVDSVNSHMQDMHHGYQQEPSYDASSKYNSYAGARVGKGGSAGLSYAGNHSKQSMPSSYVPGGELNDSSVPLSGRRGDWGGGVAGGSGPPAAGVSSSRGRDDSRQRGRSSGGGATSFQLGGYSEDNQVSSYLCLDDAQFIPPSSAVSQAMSSWLMLTLGTISIYSSHKITRIGQENSSCQFSISSISMGGGIRSTWALGHLGKCKAAQTIVLTLFWEIIVSKIKYHAPLSMATCLCRAFFGSRENIYGSRRPTIYSQPSINPDFFDDLR